MGSVAEVRPSFHDDYIWLAGYGLREADLVELRAAHQHPMEALLAGQTLSVPHCWTVDVDGQPAAMFGVAKDPRFPGVKAGSIWLLGSDRLLNVSRWVVRNSKAWLDKLCEGFDVVGNRVHHENIVHIQWLRWLGFTFIRRDGPFIEFGRICNVCYR